jgi:hypothetical protein
MGSSPTSVFPFNLMSSTTPNVIKINSFGSVSVNGVPKGTISDAILMKAATPGEFNKAINDFHSTAVQSATDAANAAIEPTHTQLAALLSNGTPGDIETAKALLATAMLPAKQKKIAAAKARLAKAQAALDAAQTT